jgi:hypothetical protein
MANGSWKLAGKKMRAGFPSRPNVSAIGAAGVGLNFAIQGAKIPLGVRGYRPNFLPRRRTRVRRLCSPIPFSFFLSGAANGINKTNCFYRCKRAQAFL